ncbi:hypothetical protein AX16_009943, partial [Volvariella volvacea WC 439]
LVLTEIELVTLAFATLNVITYGLWWNKPLNIEYPIYFDEDGIRTDGPRVKADEQEEGDDGRVKEWKGVWYERIWESTKGYIAGWGTTCHGVWQKVMRSWGDCWGKYGLFSVIVGSFSAVFLPLVDMMGEEGGENRPTSVHPFYAAKMDKGDGDLVIVYGAVIRILFGAIHLIGWNFQFSTTTELWLWRGSSLVLTVVPFFLAIAFASSHTRGRFGFGILKPIEVISGLSSTFLGAPLYFAARIILLFLAFFSLRCLPESAYQTVKWTEYIPHI